ncbi:MAG TPA: ABC transporter permease [Verrucomicrobiae bacterium]
MTNAPTDAPGPSRQSPWRQIGILYGRELRAALREKMIVINSILIPVFLYPFLLWVAFTGLMFVMGQTEGFTSRVVVRQPPREHSGLSKRLETNPQIQLLATRAPVAALREQIKEGSLDLLVEFLPPRQPGAALPGNFEVRLAFDQSKERSVEARGRVNDIVEQYRADWLKREARRRGVADSAWQGFTLSSHNVASRKEMGAFILGLLAPVIFVVMVAMGCFYPAVDAIAGERERQTWETLMSSAASRLNIVAAKYLYVVTLGGLAGILNLLAVILTLRPVFAPLLSRTGRVLECSVPLAAIPVAVLAAVLLAGFVAAGMMIFASFARTFKEGQAMVTPFYMLILVPVVFLQAPGIKSSLLLAIVPIVNVTLMLRDALSGHFVWPPALLTVFVSLAAILLSLKLAAFIIQFEDVVMGSYNGSLAKFIRQRVCRRPPPPKPS